MGLLQLCRISEMPQLVIGWECPGVSYWVWQDFKKEKEERERERERGGGREREGREKERERKRERQRGREGGREQNKNNNKKSKHWFAVTYCQNCDAPFFFFFFSFPPIPDAHLDCVVTCFTGTRFYWLGSFRQWPGWIKSILGSLGCNIVSLDFSPRGYLHIGLAFRHRMGRFFTRNPQTWLPFSTKIKHAPVSPIFFLSNIAYPVYYHHEVFISYLFIFF